MEKRQIHRGRWLVMLAVFVSTFMTSVEVTIVTTALPSIISQLHGLAYQSWIMSSYLLMTAITTPIYGKLADSFGRKKIFMFGLLIFTLGSLLSGLAPNIWFLVIFRAVQGAGSGAIMPLTFTIIADNYDFEQRAKIMAFNNTAWGISALIGPLLGGFLVDALSWHWVFFVNVPLGIFVYFITWYGYHEKFEKKVVKVDRNGIFVLSLALICLLVGIQYLENQLAFAIIIILVSLALFIFFAHYEKKFSQPLIDPVMFSNKTFSVQIITCTLLSGILVGYQIYFPIWLQSLYSVPAAFAGLVVTSSSVMWFLASFFVGRLIAKFVPKRIALTGAGILLLSYSVMVLASRSFPIWGFYLVTAINGACMGVVISMNTILSQHLVDSDKIASATSVLTLGRSLGQTIMTGILGTVLNLVIHLNLGSISFSRVNDVISSRFKGFISDRGSIDNIILMALHSVMLFSVLVVLLVILANLFDDNKRVIDQ